VEEGSEVGEGLTETEAETGLERTSSGTSIDQRIGTVGRAPGDNDY